MAFWNKQGLKRICIDCQIEYEPAASHSKRCRPCAKIQRLEASRVQQRNRDKVARREYDRKRYKKNHDTLYPKTVANHAKWRKNYPERHILGRSKQSAKIKDLEFNISETDISIPSVCPVFNRPFEEGTPYTASLDRIDNSKGYVQGNVQVISLRANMMKNDATKEELLKFADWVYKTYG